METLIGDSREPDAAGTVSTSGNNPHEHTTPSTPQYDRPGIPTSFSEDDHLSDAAAEELDELFFSKVYNFVPILHQASFRDRASRETGNVSGELSINATNSVLMAGRPQQPDGALRHMVWALAAAFHPDLSNMQNTFYRRARKSLQDEEEQSDHTYLTLNHCQAWLLVTFYEFRSLQMHKAWMSSGRATRLAQALGLDRFDSGTGAANRNYKRSETSSLTSTECEVRRRTFWLIFWADRCCSLGTGWSSAIPEYAVSQRSLYHRVVAGRQ